MYIFVSTIKKKENISQKVQQSDYEYAWNENLDNEIFSSNGKSKYSIMWKTIKDNIKLLIRNNFLFKKIFFKYENKKLFLKNFYKKNNNLVKLNYNIK